MNFVSKLIAKRYIKNPLELKQKSDSDIHELYEKVDFINPKLTLFIYFFICTPLLSFILVQWDLYNKFSLNTFVMICSLMVISSFSIIFLIVGTAQSYLIELLEFEIKTRNPNHEF